MRLRALPADAVDMSARPRRHDLLDLAETQRRAQTSGQPYRLLRLAFGQLSNRNQRGMHAVDRETNRMREFRIQQQKLCHAQRTDLRRVRLAISLESRTRFQQPHPLEIFFTLHRLIDRMRKSPEVSPNQARQFFGAFYKTPKLNVLPSFAMRHGRIGDSLEQMRPFLDGAKEHMRIQQPSLALGRAVHLQVEAVELFPHFCAALLAHLPQVLARRGHAGQNRRRVCPLNREDVGERLGIDLAIFRRWYVRCLQQSQPASRARFGRLVQPELQVNIDQTRGVFGALQVAAHPVQTVRDPRKHGCLPPTLHARAFMREAPRYPCCPRLARSSPRAILAATPRASVLPLPASHSRRTKCRDADRRAAPALRLLGNTAPAKGSASAAQYSCAARPRS